MIVYLVNMLGPKQNGWHLADDILKGIFWNGDVWISIISEWKYVGESNYILIKSVEVCFLGSTWEQVSIDKCILYINRFVQKLCL